MLNKIKEVFFTSGENKLSIYNRSIKESDKDKRLLFDNMMMAVNDTFSIHEKSEQTPLRHPIFDLIKMIGLRTQTKYLTNKLYDPSHSRLPNITSGKVFFKETIENRYHLDDYLQQYPTESYTVSLSEDLVLPWPWNYERLIDSLIKIGKGRNWGVWKKDEMNHNVELWLPQRIVFVIGGNHSITSGIIQGTGSLEPNYVFDTKPVYEYIYTDGIHYYRKKDNSIIAKVEVVEFAVLFEVGRIMVEKGIS
ncbi:MAG: DUF6710 family protein [Bacillota bacterium]